MKELLVDKELQTKVTGKTKFLGMRTTDMLGKDQEGQLGSKNKRDTEKTAGLKANHKSP